HPVSLAHQKISYIQSHRYPIFLVERSLSITPYVLVLDIVMDKRSLVEAFHRHRNLAKIFRKLSLRIFLERLERAGGQEGAPAFPGLCQPAQTDGLRLAAGRLQDRLQRLSREPDIDFGA